MFEIEEAGILDIRAAFAGKKLSSRELVLFYLKRIAELDSCLNGLKSVLEINPDALFIADFFDAETARGIDHGPLHGIPILLKDNINTSDATRTSAGSRSLANNFAVKDAHIVTLLRDAGAVILGKANMTEFAAYMSDKLPSGYSSRGGQVICPYDRTKDPSGSSSGSAVSVAANLCTASIGSETGGSIMSPAMVNGIVGVKPTLGLVSRNGVIPISNTLDTTGPMTRTVEDAAVLLSVMAGYDVDDPSTWLLAGKPAPDYLKALQECSLKGLRIGVNRKSYEKSDEEAAAFEDMLAILRNEHAVLIDGLDIDPAEELKPIMKYEFKQSMNSYLAAATVQTGVHSLRGLIEFNQRNPEMMLKYGQDTFLAAENEATGNLTEPEYIEAIFKREEIINKLNGFFADNSLDIYLCCGYTNIAPFTGFPSIAVPVGVMKDGMPIGSYWMSRRFDEATLFKAARAFEQLTKARRKPIL